MIKNTKVFLFLFLLMTFANAQAVITPNPMPPEVNAKAYILVDFNSGKVIAQKNADEKLPPASITKLMTSYVVSHELKAGNVHMDDPVLISEKAWRTGGSRTFLRVDTKVPLGVLMQGMIVQSGNDAATALAEHIAGSEDTFVQMMNQYAQQLGMTNTHYENATGLPVPDHYTTARDIATLSAALIRDFPKHYEWYSEKEFTYNGISQHNRNKLLWRDNSVDGLKTGHTEAAGYCLAASAKRGDMRLISVVLGTRSDNARAQESQKLLNYGFRFFETHQLYPANTKITETKVWKGATRQLALGLSKPLYVTVPRGQYKSLVATTHVQQPVVAPIKAGTQLGEVEIRLNNDLVAKEPLVALDTVNPGSWWRRILDDILMMIWG